MKMVKSLLLGSAAGLVAMAGAQAADMPVKAKPVQYVKICSLYGAGFYYIPGTDTCLKVGGFVRAEANFNANGSFNPYRAANFDSVGTNKEVTRVRFGISADARSQTEYGTLRAYLIMAPTDTNAGSANAPAPNAAWGGSPYIPVFAPAGFIQIAGFTMGKTASFFDFDAQPYTNDTPFWSSAQAGNGIPVLAYTAQFGNGFSASISAEDTTARSSGVLDVNYNPTGNVVPSASTGVITSNTGFGSNGYAGRAWPDFVGNLRIDQAWGSAQVMGAIHDVTANLSNTSAGYVPGPNSRVNKTGWAFGAGLQFNLPMLGKGDNVITQVTWSEGATNYLLVNSGAGGTGAFNYGSGVGPQTGIALGPVYDAVQTLTTTGGAGSPATTSGNLDLTKGWEITAGYEHHWDPKWKTSLYGGYGELRYSAAASNAILYGYGPIGPGSGPWNLVPGSAGATGITNTDANWSMYQIGSRTVWTPVENLDLSVDVIYSRLKGAFGGDTAGSGVEVFGNKGFWAGIVRAQRNFWP